MFYGDGGGKGPAIARPLYGADKVARFMEGLMRQARRLEIGLEPTEVNGEPGAVARDKHGNVASVLSVQVADGQIVSLRSVVNPDKLAHLGPVADLGEMLVAAREAG